MRVKPFMVHCHTTLGDYDLLNVNCRLSTMRKAKALAATFVLTLSPMSAKLVKGERWTITGPGASACSGAVTIYLSRGRLTHIQIPPVPIARA